MMLKGIFSLFCLIAVFHFFASEVNSKQIAVTKDGRRVILRDDGTWKYLKESNKENDIKDFRDTNWGMSKYKVKTSNVDKPIKEGDQLLVYKGTVAGKDCFILYIFAEGKLVRGKYIVTEKHSNRNDYITDYKDLKSLLTEKYGKPIKDDQFWKNDLYKDDYQEWGFAISLGHMAYFSSWETKRTTITLFLLGENYKINLGVEYRSNELKKLEEKIRLKERKKGL